MNDAFSSPGSAATHAFAYGTLQVPEVLSRVLGRVPKLAQAQLADYRRGRVLGQSYPAVVAAHGSCVEGAVLFDLRDDEWRRLDAYEGELYERHMVAVTCNSAQTWTASCYVLRPHYARLFDPAPWSLSEFVERDLATFLHDLD